MIAFNVNDMSCGHCVGTIERALRGVDAHLITRIDLATRRVEIDCPTARIDEMSGAIRSAGYTPLPVTGSA